MRARKVFQEMEQVSMGSHADTLLMDQDMSWYAASWAFPWTVMGTNDHIVQRDSGPAYLPSSASVTTNHDRVPAMYLALCQAYPTNARCSLRFPFS